MGVDAEMMARVRKQDALKEEEVLNLSWRICEALGRDAFWISREGELGNGHALSLYKHEDWEELPDFADDQLIEVSLISRYYGEGYERGPLVDFIAIAEWLEYNLPKGSEVWYGSDSSGITQLFDKKRRRELFEHFAKHGHQPYVGGRSVLATNEIGRFCEFCQHSMNQFGFGGNGLYAAFICYGCGLREKTDDGGKTWVEEKQ